MIEIVYRTEENEVNIDKVIKTPKNYKQIGEGDDSRKIYIEDYVMSYIKTPTVEKEDVKYGALMGQIKRGNGNTYIFIKGVVEVENIIENSIIFDDDTWIKLYEDMRYYFSDYEVIGWYVSMPFNLRKDLSNIKKIHLDNFAGNDKVCLFIDREDKEDNFYLYNNGIMERQSTYYIYYEKNEDMQEYMCRNNLGEPFEDKVTSKPVTTYRNIMSHIGESDHQASWKKKIPAYLQTASTFFIVVLLVAIVAIMNDYGQVKNVQKTIEGFANDLFNLGGNNQKETVAEGNAATVEIKEVDGKVQPTEDITTKRGQDQTTEEAESTQAESTTQVETTTKEEETTQTETTSQAETATTEKATESNIPAEPNYYIIQKGESLTDISKRFYNSIQMVNKIMEVNNITDGDLVFEGQKIILP